MLEHIRINLSRGYLSKKLLLENNKEFNYGIINGILLQISSLDNEKVECYHGKLPSGLSDSNKLFDYLIMYKMHDGFKPIVIKNCSYTNTTIKKWFQEKHKDYNNYNDLTKDEINNQFERCKNYYQDPAIHELNKDSEYQWIKEFEHNYFGFSDYTINNLLELVNEISRDNFCKFLKEKYSDIISQKLIVY